MFCWQNSLILVLPNNTEDSNRRGKDSNKSYNFLISAKLIAVVEQFHLPPASISELMPYFLGIAAKSCESKGKGYTNFSIIDNLFSTSISTFLVLSLSVTLLSLRSEIASFMRSQSSAESGLLEIDLLKIAFLKKLFQKRK